METLRRRTGTRRRAAEALVIFAVVGAVLVPAQPGDAAAPATLEQRSLVTLELAPRPGVETATARSVADGAIDTDRLAGASATPEELLAARRAAFGGAAVSTILRLAQDRTASPLVVEDASGTRLFAIGASGGAATSGGISGARTASFSGEVTLGGATNAPQPTGTATTRALIQLGSPFGGSATNPAVDAANGFTGNLLDLQPSPVGKLTVGAEGNLGPTPAGALTGATTGAFSGLVTLSAANNALALTGSPTTTAALLQLGSSFSGSASGTFLGVDAAGGFAGNLLDLQVNGSSRLSVDGNGELTAAGGAAIGGNVIVNGTQTLAGTVRQTGGQALFTVSATPNSYDAASSNQTLVAADLLTNRIAVVTNAIDGVTLPAAAGIIRAGSLSTNDVFAFLISNADPFADAAVSAGAGVTMGGGILVRRNDARVFYCRVTGASSITCY